VPRNPGLKDCNPFGIASGGEDGQILLKAMRTLTEVPVKKTK
jgi:hypothetical protein